VADTVHFMDHGQVVESGPPEQLFEAASSRRLQDFPVPGALVARPLQDLLRFGKDPHPIPACAEAHPQHEARVLAAFESDTAAAGRSGSSTTPADRADQPVSPRAGHLR